MARKGIYIAVSCLMTTGWLVTAHAQETKLDVPTEVVAGAKFKVNFTVVGSDKDYITYTDPDAEPKDDRYGYQSVSKGSPITFQALVKPGT